MRKKNAMVKEQLSYQMATNTRASIRVDKDMDTGNTHLSAERPGSPECAEKSYST